MEEKTIQIVVKFIPNTMQRQILPSQTTGIKTSVSKPINTRVAFLKNVKDVKLHLSCKRYTIQPLSLQFS